MRVCALKFLGVVGSTSRMRIARRVCIGGPVSRCVPFPCFWEGVLAAPSRGVTLGGGVVSFARLSGCPRRLVGADHSAAIQCCHSMLTVLVLGVCPGIRYSRARKSKRTLGDVSATARAVAQFEQCRVTRLTGAPAALGETRVNRVVFPWSCPRLAINLFFAQFGSC